MGPTALLPLRRKACWGFFSPEKSDGFGRVWTRELGCQRPARYLQTTEAASCMVLRTTINFVPPSNFYSQPSNIGLILHKLKLKPNTWVFQKISLRGVSFRNETAHYDSRYMRGILCQVIIICFQHRRKVLEATKMISRWKQSRQDGWQQRK